MLPMLAGRVACALGLLMPSIGLAASCNSDDREKQGALMVVIRTDLEVPKDVTSIRLAVSAGGVPRHDVVYDVGPGAQLAKLPGTFAILAGSNPSVSVKIRVIAYRGPKDTRRPFVLREAITTVPADRVAMLPMPVNWLCWGQLEQLPSVSGEDLDASPNCEAEDEKDPMTCAAGRCVPASIESSTLPDYTPEKVFGGAAGVCHDTLGCFEQGFLEPLNVDRCSIRAPEAGGEQSFNVALVLPPAEIGICNSSGCLVTLDADPEEGYEIVAGEVRLPALVCQQVLDGSVLAIAATRACPTKTPAIPTCGPWSAVGSQPGTRDGGATFPSPDPCSRKLDSDGRYCGGDLPGADVALLYDCQAGATISTQSCAAGCAGGACLILDGGVGSIGSACTGDTDCDETLTCLLPVDRPFAGAAGPANGMCSLDCTDDPTVCGPEAVCVVLYDNNWCLRSCTIGSLTCRRGDAACQEEFPEATTQAPVEACLPVCGFDWQCAPLTCDLWTGWCFEPRNTGSLPIGEACEWGGDCESAFCNQLDDGQSSASFCSGLCVLGAPTGCAWDGTAPRTVGCFLPADPRGGPGDLGYCTPLCDASDYCSCPGGGAALGCQPFDKPEELNTYFPHTGTCLPHWLTTAGAGGC
jgi:hypothetical protein